jgi:hypothetical protein
MTIGLVNFDYNIHYKIASSLCEKRKDISHCFGYVLPPANSKLSKVSYVDATILYDIKNFSTNKIRLINFKKRQELTFYNIFDRVSNFTHSQKYKKLFFNNLVNYWLEFFNKNNKLNLLIFSSVPHRPWDFALYLVAKKIKKKIIIFSRTSITNLVYFRKDFEKNSIIDIKTENSISHEKFNDMNNFINFLDKNNLSRSGNIFTNRFYFTNSKFSLLAKKLLGEFIFLFLQISLFFAKSFFAKIPVQSIKISYNSYPSTIFAANKYKINRFSFIFYSFRYAIKIFYLKIIDLIKFEKEKIDFLEKNYIFFPLHFQPERSTLPEGWLFSDQLKAIKILSNIIPKNWKIVVKEHPRQLIIDYRNFHYRSKKFYIDLQKIKNVIYMSSKSNYLELLKHCRVTATISGSVTFDGLLINKPGITFASTWLDDHRYVNLYKNLPDLTFFLKNIKNNKFTKFEKELKNFFLRNRGKFYNGCSFDGWWSIYSRKIRNIMIKNSVNALLKCINLQNK